MQATHLLPANRSLNWSLQRSAFGTAPAASTCASADAQAADNGSRPVKSCDLLNGQKAVDIEHNGTVYRLHTTKLGKLILTK